MQESFHKDFNMALEQKYGQLIKVIKCTKCDGNPYNHYCDNVLKARDIHFMLLLEEESEEVFLTYLL